MLLNRVRRVAPVVAVLPLLAAVACGSKSSGSSATGGSSSPANNLPSNKATGSTVVLGFINTDSSPVGDFSDVTTAAKAEVNYLNNNAGGIGGHVIDLETCTSDGSTSSSATCATQLLAKNPIAILGGLDLGADGSVPVVTKAGVPYIGTIAANASELATPGTYVFSSGVAGAVGAADLFAAKGLKAGTVGIITNDTATAKGAATQLAQGVLTKLGVKAKVVTHSVNETDLTATWASASNGANAVFAIESSSACVAAMKARAAASSTIPIIMFGCTDTGTLKAAGSTAEGAYFGSPLTSPNASDTNTVLYRNILSAYAPKVQIDEFTQSPISSMMILKSIVGTSTDLTAASLKTALSAAKDVPGFMTPSITCDGKQVPQLVGLCTGGAYVLQNKGGVLSDAGGGELDLFAALS